MTAQWLTHPKTLAALKRLVRHNAVPWGCLKDLSTAQQVLEQLTKHPPVRISDFCTTLIDVYHSADLGVGCVTRIACDVLENAMQAGWIDPETPVTLYYRWGNLLCLIKPEYLAAQVSLSQDVYLMVNAQSQALFATHIGKYHWHHALYEYHHLHKRVTTLKKLLDTKRFSSVYIDTDSDNPNADIPY